MTNERYTNLVFSLPSRHEVDPLRFDMLMSVVEQFSVEELQAGLVLSQQTYDRVPYGEFGDDRTRHIISCRQKAMRDAIQMHEEFRMSAERTIANLAR